MPHFRKRPVVAVEQFNHPPLAKEPIGVCENDECRIVTIQGVRTPIRSGEWVMPSPISTEHE